MENNFIPSLFDEVVLQAAIQPSTSLCLEYITIIQSITNSIVHITPAVTIDTSLVTTITSLVMTITSLVKICINVEMSCTIKKASCPVGLIMQTSPFIYIAA